MTIDKDTIESLLLHYLDRIPENENELSKGEEWRDDYFFAAPHILRDILELIWEET